MKHKWIFSICATSLLLTSTCLAGPPDSSFKSAGQLYMARSQGQTADTQLKEVILKPDPGYLLDMSYRQNAVPPGGFSGGGASSSLQPSSIPPGVYIEVSGGHYWSVQPPLKVYGNLDDATLDGRLTSYTFAANLYCGPEPAPGPGCNCTVNVWFKQKPIPVTHAKSKVLNAPRQSVAAKG